MKNSLHSLVLACGLFIISTVGITAFADEQKVFKTNEVVTHSLNKLPVFPLQQKPIEKAEEGKVRFYNIAENQLASHLSGADQDEQEWMVNHYDRMQVYTPYFDQYTEWYRNGLVYKDLYAIYNCTDFKCDIQWPDVTEYIFNEHPEWILRDIDGKPLYLPFGCSRVKGSCPQFAADISNPEFRQFWIDDLNKRLGGTCGINGKGYRGIMVDDVNLALDKSVVKMAEGLTVEIVNGQYQYYAYTLKSGNPINSKTGDPIEDWQWKKYVAEFVELIRSEFQACEIMHNSVWFHTKPGDPYLDRQVDAADYLGLERGVNDLGMKAGTHPLGIVSFFEFNDYLHERGRNMVHYIHIDERANAVPPLKQLEYGLAGWLLVSDGNDLFGARKFNTPADWWQGFDTNLGQALGSRYKDFQGLFRRDFEHGIVLLNGPGTGSVTVTLPDTYYTLAGDPVDEVVLGSRVGKILLLNPPPKWDWNVLDGPVPPGAQTALGDGSDELATLQNVIDLAAPSDVIYFPEPPVAYGVAGNLRIEKPLTMLGDGWLNGSAITDGNFGGAELRQLDNGPTMLLQITSSDVLIDGLRLMGTEYGSATDENQNDTRNTSGINVSGLSSKQHYANITVRNSWIQRYRGNGIRIDLAEDVVIDNNRIEDVTYGGIFIVSVDRAIINNNVVEDIGNPEIGSAYENAYPIVVTSKATEEYPHCTNILIQNNIVRDNPVWTGIMNHGGNNVGVFDNEVYDCDFAYALTFSGDNTGHVQASTRTWFVNNYAENSPRNAQWFVGPEEGGSVNHAAIGNVYTSTTDSSIGPIWINNLDGLIFTYNSISGIFDAENRAIRWGQLNSYWDKPILNVSRVGNNLDGGRETFEFDPTHCSETTPEDCILAPLSTAPSAPTNLKALQTKNGVLLTWTNTTGNGHDSFYIEQSLDGVTGWTRVAFRPPDDGQWDFGSTNPHWQAFDPLRYLHRGATNGFYRIRAQNGEQTSPWSKAIAVFP